MRQGGVARAKQIAIDPARPQPPLRQASIGEFVAQRRGGNQHRARRGMKAAHQWPEPLRAKAGADRGIIGKAGVERGGEGQLMRQAPVARAPADRTLGGDMHDVWRKITERAACPKARHHRQADFAVAGQGQGAELLRGDQFNLVPAFDQLGHRGRKRADHAVDLGMPGVSTNGDSHAGSFAVLGDCAGASGLGPVAARRCSSAQSISDIAPAWSSTKAVQLSTQSPSL